VLFFTGTKTEDVSGGLSIADFTAFLCQIIFY